MKLQKKFKMCRRLGAGVFEKCQSPKFLASQAKKGRASVCSALEIARGKRLVGREYWGGGTRSYDSVAYESI